MNGESQRVSQRMKGIGVVFLTGVLVGCGGGGDTASSQKHDRAPIASVEQSDWFQEIAFSSGIKFAHQSGHRERFYIPEIVTGGVALFDFDNDGNLDIYFVQGGSLRDAHDSSTLPTSGPGNQLYHNRGNGSFEKVTEGSGADDRGYGIGVTTGDFNNDGATDLYITNLGRNTLLRNEGDGTFEDVTETAGVGDSGFGSSAAFLDYDHDGDLDLFVLNYLIWSPETEKDCFNSIGQPDYCSPKAYNAPAIDVLYRNEGDGTFTNVTDAAGISSAFGTGLGVVCGDFTGDGWVDIFVANDGKSDQLWVNLGNGRFEDHGLLLGCAMDQEGKAKAGMGVTAADIDNDGHLDLLVGNLTRETDSFFLNEGGYFNDSTAKAGLGALSRVFTRFGLAWQDFNNDGWLDLYQANGRVAMESNTPDPDDPFAEPNLLYQGGEGIRFEEVLPRGGTKQLLVGTSRAAAFGDLDNDGGIDIVVMNRDAAPYVLQNIVADRGNWLTVRVLEAHGRDALGATVSIQSGGHTLRQDVRTAYSYCAANDSRVHFGLGEDQEIDSLMVLWVDGTRERFAVSGINQIMTVHQGSGILVNGTGFQK